MAVFTRTYSLARSTGILKLSWFRKAFTSSYFFYKRLYEDPLVRQKPGLFLNGDILDIGANIGYTACLFAMPGEKATSVAATSVDEFVRMRGLQRIAFVKDMQGYELAVCEGMRKTPEQFPRAPVSIECSPTRFASSAWSRRSCFNFSGQET